MDWLPEFFQKFPPLAMVAVTFNTFDQQGQRLIDEPVLNTVIVLMVVTSILGPVLTERFALKILGQRKAEQPS